MLKFSNELEVDQKAFYGQIASDQFGINASDAFQVSTSGEEYGQSISFSLTINADGIISSYVFTAMTEGMEMPFSSPLLVDTTW